MKSDFAKLRRENEALRLQLAALQGARSITTDLKPSAEKPGNSGSLNFDFKYLKKDLLRTAMSSAVCLGVIGISYIAILKR